MVFASFHRRNWDGCLIQTVKNHFIAGLCSTDPNLPLNLWCKLVARFVITLNLLRSFWINPKLSAHAQVFGNFDNDCTTMDPPSIKVTLHERPKDRGLWYSHALSGCYIGPSLEHYRCHKIWLPPTNSVWIEQNVSWFTHKLIMTNATATDIITATAKYWTAAVKKTNRNLLLPPSDTITRKAL